MATTTPSTIKAIRSAETGCVVYIDASAIPAGVKHGAAECRCVKIHGPEELEYIQNSIRVFLATGNDENSDLSSSSSSAAEKTPAYCRSVFFGAKPSVEIAHMLLGMTTMTTMPGGAGDNKWKKEGKTWWSMLFAGK